MAPLVLEGQTLGQKHRHFNSLVKEACSKPGTLEKINFDDTDIDNLIKIDVACTRRDVDYVLEALKSEDMLYVSRAIKKSTWLVTDDQYSHIVNPKYLHEELFPYMTSKAKNKLLLAIRLNLVQESRVEAFFTFFENDIGTAQKWLPRCSMPFIEKELKKNAKNITVPTFKRLCEKSFEVLKIFAQCDEYPRFETKSNLKNAMFLLHNNTEQFLDIVEKLESYSMPEFGKKFTRIIMRKCPERVLKNFHKYCDSIDLSVFARHMKKENIEDFLLKQKEDKKMKYWFTFEKVKHFVRYLPKERRFQYIKQMFIEKSNDSDTEMLEDDAVPYQARSGVAFKCSAIMAPSNSYSQIYRWYRFAPFGTAFAELKKIIRMEPSPAERNSILTILLYSAAHNSENIQTLLQHYRSKHINEPFKFKIQFVNSLLTQTDAYKFDENTWSILNDIFSSMEVYMESENSVSSCIHTIILRNLLHGQDIPEIVDKKFTFNSLKKYRKKLNVSDQEKLFSYLYNNVLIKLQKQPIGTEADIIIAVGIVNDMLSLLKDWDKKIIDYPVVINKIREISVIKKEHSYNIKLANLYNVQKPWRKHMFEESLVLYPSDDACLNALKHGPELLSRYKSEVEAMFSNDSISLTRVLKKIRIYWSHSLAQSWCDAYLERVDKASGQRAVVEGICILLPRDRALPIIEKYAPIDSKIDWSHTSGNIFNVRKNLAKQMQLIRPPVDLDAVLLYSKEDYLQYALPSLNALLHNMSAKKISTCFLKLLDKPVSLQKHGIRIAFTKLKLSEIKDLFSNIWKNTTNSTIKTVLFKQTHKLLCEEKDETIINEIWNLLSVFIENLSSDESKTLYTLLTEVQNIPSQLQGKFLMKSYLYLKSLPSKANSGSYLRNLELFAPEIIDKLEQSFIEDVLLKSLPDIFVKQSIVSYGNDQLNLNLHILSVYLLSSKTEVIQNVRYEKVLSPLIDRCLASWKLRKDKEYLIKKNFQELLERLTRDLTVTVLSKNVTIPVQLFKNIRTKIGNALTPEEDYDVLIKLNLLAIFVESLNKYMQGVSTLMEVDNDKLENETKECVSCVPKNKDGVWQKICDGVTPYYGKECLNYFKQDSITRDHPCLYSLTSQILRKIFYYLKFDNSHEYKTVKCMLSDPSVKICYFIAIEVVQNCGYYGDVEAIRKEICKVVRAHPSEDIKICFNAFYNVENFDLGE